MKRSLSLFLVFSFAGAQLTHCKNRFAGSTASSFVKSPLTWVLGFNAACLVGLYQLHQQKNADLETYKTMKSELESKNNKKSLAKVLQQKKCQNKAELDWAERYDQAREFDLPRERDSKLKALKGAAATLRKQFGGKTMDKEIFEVLSIYVEVANALENNIFSHILPEFEQKIKSVISTKKEELKKELSQVIPTSSKTELCTKRIKILSPLIQWLREYDFANNLQKERQKKITELDQKIVETPKSRDRLWMVPVAINGLIAIACGIKHYLKLGSK